MSKVFIGNITSSAERLISAYLDKFMPDVVVEPLKAAGIKGKIKNHARRPEVVLVILDETFYNMCKGVADDVLSLPKVHKYVSDSGLQEFLVEKFGVLDSVPAVERVEVPEIHVNSEIIEDDFENESLTVSDLEDTSNDDRDSVIQKLNDEIIIRDTMIRNLEAQIEEKSGSDNVSHFIERIKSLEKNLEDAEDRLSKVQNESYTNLGKITRAEQIIKSVDTLKEELKAEKLKCSSLESNKLELEARVQEQKQEVDRLRLSVVELGDKISELDAVKSKFDKQEEDLRVLQEDLDIRTSELKQTKEKCTFLDAEVFDLNGKLSELGVLNEKIDSLEAENKKLSDSVVVLSNLKLELENLHVDYDKVVSDKKSLELKISELKLELEESLTSNTTMEVANNKLERDIKSLQLDNDSISKQLIEVTDKIKSKDDEIEKLRKDLVSSAGIESELKGARQEIALLKESSEELSLKLKLFDDTKASLDDKVFEVEDLQRKLSEKSKLEENLESKISELVSVKEELSSKTEELNILRNEKNLSSNEISEKTNEIRLKNEKLSKLELEVSKLTSELEDLRNRNNELVTTNKKLSNEVDIFKAKVEESSTLLQNNSQSEKEVLEYKRKIARLQAENESLKEDLEETRGTTNKDVEISKLRSEISDYKEKLRQAVDLNNEKNKLSKSEVIQLRERCASLEVSLVEKENELLSTTDSVFSRMGSIASPKTMFNLTLDVPKELSNMFVVASGSSESNLITYQTLRRFCASNNKSVLILDLVTDSYIDREFGAEGIRSPIEFLQGYKPITDFVTSTKVANTHVSSTAFSYLNILYLLNVDWQERLAELTNLTDIVIINVGCLNEVVSKVLFNAFSEVMDSHIIIKASPINLRTALLTLTGISSAKRSKVSCVGFENSSKAMYQRLAQKFNTQILKDSDVLKL